jgi:hypothetical protein
MRSATPTVPPPQPEDLSSSLKRNIEALEERRREEAASATRQERLAEAITSFTGSMPFGRHEQPPVRVGVTVQRTSVAPAWGWQPPGVS